MALLHIIHLVHINLSGGFLFSRCGYRRGVRSAAVVVVAVFEGVADVCVGGVIDTLLSVYTFSVSMSFFGTPVPTI